MDGVSHLLMKALETAVMISIRRHVIVLTAWPQSTVHEFDSRMQLQARTWTLQLSNKITTRVKIVKLRTAALSNSDDVSSHNGVHPGGSADWISPIQIAAKTVGFIGPLFRERKELCPGGRYESASLLGDFVYC
jgi:hypothetical protein